MAESQPDLTGLASYEKGQISDLIDLILTFLVTARGDFQAGLGSFAEEHKLDTQLLKVLVRGLIVFLQQGVREGWSASQLESRCSSLSLSSEVVAVIVSRWQHNSTQMVRSLLDRTVGANKLIDMDWSFGVTASSDDCDQVGKTFLQLKLTLDHGSETGDGSGTRVVFLELSLDQFFAFLASMEFVNSYLSDN